MTSVIHFVVGAVGVHAAVFEIITVFRTNLQTVIQLVTYYLIVLHMGIGTLSARSIREHFIKCE